MRAHHNHASDPEEQDVVSRFEQASRVEEIELRRLKIIENLNIKI